MKKISLGQVLGILANAGVIGGLIFVGFQLQQDREIAIAALRQETLNSEMYWAELVELSPDVWSRGLAGETLSPDEAAQFDALAGAREAYWWVTYMHAQSLLDFDSGRLIRAWAFELNESAGLMSWWREYLAESEYINPTPISQWAEAVNNELERVRAEAESGEF
jgi:hypothetical protein